MAWSGNHVQRSGVELDMAHRTRLAPPGLALVLTVSMAELGVVDRAFACGGYMAAVPVRQLGGFTSMEELWRRERSELVSELHRAEEALEHGRYDLARGAIEPVGLVTALDPFTRLDLIDFADIVVGGHDIRPGRLADEARRMWTDSRAIMPELLDGAADFFAETETRIRPGTIVAAGDKIRELADDSIAARVETPRQAIDRVRADIEAFADIVSISDG